MTWQQTVPPSDPGRPQRAGVAGIRAFSPAGQAVDPAQRPPTSAGLVAQLPLHETFAYHNSAPLLPAADFPHGRCSNYWTNFLPMSASPRSTRWPRGSTTSGQTARHPPAPMPQRESEAPLLLFADLPRRNPAMRLEKTLKAQPTRTAPFYPRPRRQLGLEPCEILPPQKSFPLHTSNKYPGALPYLLANSVTAHALQGSNSRTSAHSRLALSQPSRTRRASTSPASTGPAFEITSGFTRNLAGKRTPLTPCKSAWLDEEPP